MGHTIPPAEEFDKALTYLEYVDKPFSQKAQQVQTTKNKR
jgi:hypothetical protein